MLVLVAKEESKCAHRRANSGSVELEQRVDAEGAHRSTRRCQRRVGQFQVRRPSVSITLRQIRRRLTQISARLVPRRRSAANTQSVRDEVGGVDRTVRRPACWWHC